ncbi:unnamed protein product [Gongylonema pulchrum]|uniref:tRNA wybutosine-synthesizing protein 2 homolog n=1 Tax=Gongylonema pulchrum TaxID=637853 RepID=A0A183DY74_9BILA|nr:unnamed protein product [Gongylonema pulchrum]
MIFQPVISMPSGDEKGIVFCPEKIDNETRVSVLKIVDDITDSSARFDSYSLTVHYDDWPVKGFAQIGHIVHVNLREELLPYKKVIGQILFDKIASCKTVVNKLDAIGHKYRTFELDLLAGEANYETEVHEDKLRYQLNFKQVFYNPRLSTEHKRIVKKIGKRSILYDCCAGIGPFVLPAVRNGAHHLSTERLKMYNMDAALFISTALADDLANEFKNFKTTASGYNDSLQFPLYVHCHFFVKAPEDVEDNWYKEEARNLVRASLG